MLDIVFMYLYLLIFEINKLQMFQLEWQMLLYIKINLIATYPINKEHLIFISKYDKGLILTYKIII